MAVVNNKATFSLVNGSDTSIIEDEGGASGNMVLTATGTVKITDIAAEAFFTSVTGSDSTGSGGIISGNTLIAQGTYGSLSINSKTGEYVYSVIDSAVQFLDKNEVVKDIFSLTSKDGTKFAVNFSVTGTNDVASIILDASSTTAIMFDSTSRASSVATGHFTVTDADGAEQSVMKAATYSKDSGSGHIGTLVVKSDGSYTYTVDGTAAAKIAKGVVQADTFNVVSADGTTKEIVFQVTGGNHAASINLDPGATTKVVTDTTREHVSVAEGHITVNDSDASDTSKAVTLVVDNKSHYGNLVFGENGNYTYTVKPETIAALAKNESHTDSFTVQSADGTQKSVTFTVVGGNHAAVIGQPTVANVTEDLIVRSHDDDDDHEDGDEHYAEGNHSDDGDDHHKGDDDHDEHHVETSYLVAHGTISVSDVDRGENELEESVKNVLNNNGEANLGKLHLEEHGEYTYKVDNAKVQYLKEGETKEEVFEIESEDGTKQEIKFYIHGKNDSAVIGDAPVNAVTEDTAVNGNHNLTAVGKITVTDVDHGEAGFQTEVAGKVGNLGSLDIAADGSYTYTVSNDLKAVQSLGVGESHVDVFTVKALDGTTKDISFTINGDNDTPTVEELVDQIASVGEEFTYEIPADTFKDVDLNDILTLSATMANGDALPDWISFDAATGTFTASATANNTQTLELKVTATDNHQASASTTFHLKIENDGISSTIENEVPVMDVPNAVAGDGNGDGIKDSLQSNVASLEVPTTQVGPDAPPATWLTIAADDSGVSLDHITITEAPPADELPSGVMLPFGQFNFNANVAVGGSVDTSIYLSGDWSEIKVGDVGTGVWTDAVSGQQINGYWKQDGITGEWSDVSKADGISLDNGKLKIVITLTDGDSVSDKDSTANGVIVDPGAPGYFNHATTVDVAITAIDNDSGKSDSDFLTNDTNLVVSGTNGTLNLGEKVQIRYGEADTWHDVVEAEDGLSWTYSDEANTHETNVTYEVRVLDVAGNPGNSDSQLVTIDIGAPAAGTLELSAFTDTAGSSDSDFLSSDKNFGLSLSEQEDGADVTYQVSTDGGSTWVKTTDTPADHTDGTYEYRAIVTDAAGNESTTNAITVTIDTTATAGTLHLSNFSDSGNSSDHLSNDKTFGLSLENNESGGSVTYQIKADDEWETTSSTESEHSDGTYEYRAKVTDAAGNTSYTDSVTVTIDTTATAGTLHLSNFSDSGNSSDHLSNDKTFGLSLENNESGGSVTYQIKADDEWETTSSTESEHSDGTYEYRAKVTDAAGNTSTTNSVTVTVDTTATAGTLSLSSFVDSGNSSDHLSNDKTFGLSLDGNETGGSVTYQVKSGSSWTDTSSTSTDHSDGNYEYRAIVVDAAGNTSTTNSVTVTVDTTATAGALSLSNFVDSGNSSDHLSNDKTFGLSLDGNETGGSVTYQVKSGSSWTDTSSTSTDHSDGDYEYRAIVVDAAGNTSTTNSVTVTIDTTATAGTLSLSNFVDSGNSSDHLSNDKTFGLSLDGNETGGSVTYQVKSGSSWTNTSSEGADHSDGNYEYRAIVTDAAGNTSTTNSVTVTIDTTATAGTLSLSNFVDSANSSDHLSNDKTFGLSLDGNETGGSVTYQVKSGSSWTDTSSTSTDHSDGNYEYRAIVTDAAGNTSTTSSVTVTIDTSATAGTLSLSNFSDSGTSSSDFISNDKTFGLILGGNETGGSVTYQAKAGSSWTDTSANSTDHSDANYEYRAVVTDAAGNTATTNSVTVTVDTTATAGSVALSSFSDTGSSSSDLISNDKTYGLTVAGGETEGSVTYKVSTNGSTWNTISGDVVSHSDGTYNYKAVVSDIAGNTATTGAITVTIDTSTTAGSLTLSNFSDSGTSASDKISNDKTFGLSLSGNETGSSVTYEVSTDAGSNWTDTSSGSTVHSDASYQYRAVISDVAGNSATTNTVTATVDTTATAGSVVLSSFSDTGTSSSDLISNDKTYGLSTSGTESGASVTYKVSADNGSNWSTTSDASVSHTDDTYNYKAVVSDVAGNTSTTSVITVTIDTVAPTSGSLSLSNFSDSGTSASDKISNDKTFGLSLSGGETSGSVTYEVSTDGGSNWTDTSSASTVHSDDSYQYRAVVSDVAGNSSTSNTVTATIDTTATAGVVVLSSFSDTGSSSSDLISNDKTFGLSLSGNETGGSVTYKVSADNGSNWATTSEASVSHTDDTYNYKAIVTDAAGNTATTVATTVTIDTVAPTSGTLSLSNFSDSGTSASDKISNDKTFGLSLSGNETASSVVYEVSTNAGSNWAATSADSVDHTDAAYQYHAVVSDVAGNNATTNTVTATVDTTATAGSVVLSSFSDSGSSSSDLISNDKTYGLSTSGTESGAQVTYQVSADNGSNWATTSNASVSHTDNTYDYKAVVIDAAGNTATTAAITVTIDTTATAGTLSLSGFSDTGISSSDSLSNDKTFGLSLSGNESGSTVAYQVSTNAGTSWSNTSDASATHTDAAYQYQAVVTDVAGNIATTTALTVTVDTTATAGTLSLSNFSDSGISASDKISNDQTFGLSLTGNETGGSVTYQVSTNAGSTWGNTTEASVTHTDGSYQYQTIVSDAAGNTSTTTAVSVTVDTVSGTAGTLAFSGFSDSGTNDSDLISNDKTFGLSLSGNTTGGTITYQVSTNAGSTWTDTTYAEVTHTDGAYQYKAIVTDVAGNASTTSAITVTIDSTATAGTLSLSNFSDSGSSSSDLISNDKTFGLSLAGNETGGSVTYQVKSGTSWSDTSATEVTHTDGTYVYRAIVSDAVGNTSTSSSVTVTIDTTATAGTLSLSGFSDTGSNRSDFISTDRTFGLTLTGEETSGSTVYQVSTNSGSSWGDTSAAEFSHSNASYQYQAVVTDAAGNSATTSAISVRVTNTAPPIAMDVNGDGTVDYLDQSAGVTYDFSLTGATPVATSWVAAGDGFLAAQTGDASKLQIVFATQDGETDLQGLARVYDTNLDTMISNLDAQFGNLGIWQDANSNGVVDAGEFKSLDAAGIVSISTLSDNVASVAASGGVAISGHSTFTKADGTVGVLDDMSFVEQPAATTTTATTVAAAATDSTAPATTTDHTVVAAATDSTTPATTTDHTVVVAAEVAAATTTGTTTSAADSTATTPATDATASTTAATPAADHVTLADLLQVPANTPAADLVASVTSGSASTDTTPAADYLQPASSAPASATPATTDTSLIHDTVPVPVEPIPVVDVLHV